MKFHNLQQCYQDQGWPVNKYVSLNHGLQVMEIEEGGGGCLKKICVLFNFVYCFGGGGL